MLNDYFFARVVEAVGKDKAGGHFVAVTDPGSALEKTAKADRLRRVSLGQPNIGGAIRCSRRSAWSRRRTGIDIARLLETAQAVCGAYGDDLLPADNPPCSSASRSASPVVKGATRSRFSPRPSSSISAPGPSSSSRS